VYHGEGRSTMVLGWSNMVPVRSTMVPLPGRSIMVPERSTMVPGMSTMVPGMSTMVPGRYSSATVERHRNQAEMCSHLPWCNWPGRAGIALSIGALCIQDSFLRLR
jgi:hypothetical protein